MEKHPSLSVITVVFNAVELIEETIKSIIGQTYPNIEYIIIDGLSTDGTLDLIKKYQKNISFWISEKDAGIYDAMNKGLRSCHGDYILFINAGDKLKNPTTIQKIFVDSSDSDIYYGEVELINKQNEIVGMRRLKPPRKLNWKSFQWGMVVSHQAFIVKKTLVEYFDLKYRIASDIDWCIKCMYKANTLTYVDLTISQFLLGGKSRQNTLLAWVERFKIMKIYYGLFSTLWFHLLICFRFIYFYIFSRKLD